MSPELTILIINGVLMAFGYLVAYPALSEKTMPAIMWRDAVISGAALFLAGLLYWGSDIAFSLIVFDTNWFFFSVLTLMVIETPLFIWFAAKHDIKF
ncbi:hypothetical protein [Yoonia sp. 208BN28-4]|uniref:hypothetical protein n=1 Tax=Yoonia sp. 208BN28-4 TaxID=3126505 RepID=UPI0030949ADA